MTADRDGRIRLGRGHACSFYEDASNGASEASNYLGQALARLERCLVAESEGELEAISRRLAEAGVDVERERERAAFVSVGDRNGFLTAGRLDSKKLLEGITAAGTEASEKGFTGLCCLLGMAWLLGPTVEPGRLLELETWLQDWVEGDGSVTLICHYDRARFDPALLHDVARRHTTVLVGGREFSNPYYEPPELIQQGDAIGPDLKRERFRWWMKRLLESDPEKVAEYANRPGSSPPLEGSYRRLLEAFPHVVWLTGPDGGTDFLNQEGIKKLGISAERLYGWGWLDLIHPDFVAQSRSLWEAAVRTESPYRNEYKVKIGGDAYRWVLSQAIPIRDEDGSVQRWVGTWTDIDHLKRAEEDASRKALLLANVRDAVVVTDLEGVVTYWNEGATRLFGWTAEEAVGSPLTERFPETFRPSVKELTRDFAGGTEWSREWLDYRKDGSRVWIDLRVARITDANGKPFGIMSVSHDISDRKRAEADLHLRDRAIQALNQGIVITDSGLPDNPIIYASPSFERLTGYSSEEVQGRECGFLWGKDTDPEAVVRLYAAMREGKAESVEVLSYRKDKTPFWNGVSASPVNDETGKLTHFVFIHNDVTARRRLEEQYRQAQKMEAIGLLGGGVAHDFNNLLTIITGYTELLLHSLPTDDPRGEMLEEIRKAGERSVSLTRQLLAFSRRQVLAPRVLDLNEVVRNTETMLRRVIGEDIELTTNLQPGLGHVRGDPGQLEQVLLNLAVNARDAMPHGGKLALQTKETAIDGNSMVLNPALPAGQYVVLTVADSGIGMSDEVRQRLFEPFFTTKARDKGTGLGASVALGIIEQSGGRIEVESSPGRGSVFNIYLPIVAEPTPADGRQVLPKPAVKGSEVILLAEDDDGVRALSLQILKDCGYEVLEARDGEEALQIEARHSGVIDLLVTDVVMPGMGGRELSEKLLLRRPQTKVLFLSGYTDDAVVRYGVLRDRVNFLQKPFPPGKLASKVRAILEN